MSIWVTYGNDPTSMTLELLKAMDPFKNLKPTASIVLKPNLVVAKPASEGATTHPQIVEALIVHLQAQGFSDIAIVESSWIGESTQRSFKAHGYDTLARKYGIGLVDVKQDRYVTVSSHGYEVEMSKKIMEADFLINLPVLKGHCQTKLTCALKNMKGCISDRSKRAFHSWGLHEPIAALNAIKQADLIIVDSINGDLDFEEGGNPVQTNRMFGGFDSTLIDAFGATLLGYEPAEIKHVAIAAQWKLGSIEVEKASIKELKADTTAAAHRPTGRIKTLERYTQASSACSACYGNLIHALARLDEKGLLQDLVQKVHIGQDYKGKSGCGIGVGICTNGFTHFLPGCPPKALDMVRFLHKQIEE